MKRYFLTFGLFAVALAACSENGQNGINGHDGKDGASCTFTANSDGTTTITCPDGSSFTVKNGEKGQKGDAGSDGNNGQNGTYCQLLENIDGSQAVVCPADGTSYIVRGNVDHYTNYCLPGSFGPNCQPCTCKNGTCKDTTQGDGTCSDCEDGWIGENCDIKASCVNGTAKSGPTADGTCSKCNNKWTGDNCDVCPTNWDGSSGENCTRCIVTNFGDNCQYTTGDTGSMTDNHGNTYSTITIGDQIWMAENMHDETDVTCYKDNSNSNWTDIYGCLYTWEDANKVCPSDWRLPTYDDFDQLLTTTTDGRGFSSLRASSWANGSNSSGFGALPAGYRLNNDFFLFFAGACIWSATPYGSDYAYSLCVFTEDYDVGVIDVNYAFSVRCVKDAN